MSYLIDDSNAISRRTFTLEAALAILGCATITVSGCGDSTPSTPTTTVAAGDVSGNIAGNHGHAAVITAAQITAAGALSLNIRGQASHPHTVSLTGAQVGQIGNRQQVTVTSSSDDGHTHIVTFG